MARRRYQRGSVRLRGKKNPVWEGRWREDVVLPGGKVERVYRSEVLGQRSEISTKRLAERRLEIILARINAPSYRPGRISTVEEFAERWKALVLHSKPPKLKPSTARAFESHLGYHILPQLGRLRLDQLGPETQQVFVNYLSERMSLKSVVNVLGTLSSMLGKARKWGYICEGVDLKNLELPERPIQSKIPVLTADQIKRILEAAEDPYRTMFACAAMAGLRAGEVLGLSVDDLGFEKRAIWIRRSAWRGQIQTPKSQNSEAVLPMPEPLAAILREYLTQWQQNPERLLFINRRGRPYTAEKVVQKKLYPILKMLGIPRTLRRSGFHAFRHAHTSLLLDGGAPVTVAQKQLRHSDARITLGIYGHVIEESHRKAIEELAKVLNPNAPKSEASAQWVQ